MADKMKRVMILKKTLQLEGETTVEFAQELRKLTDEDKKELAELGAKMLGVEIED